MFLAYDLLIAVAVWTVLVPWQVLQILMGRSRPAELRERLGLVAPLEGTARRVVVHAVSVGEVAAARPLIRELHARGIRVVLTVGNRAGREAAESLRNDGEGVERVLFLPWDRRRASSRWLHALRAECVAVLETEIWPNLFRVCADDGVRLLVVSGRIYPADVRRYRLARPFFQRVLAFAEAIYAQDDVERDRYVAIGARPERVFVGGNLKIDGARTNRFASSQRELILLGGSTHAPEEEMLVDVYVRLRGEIPDLRLVLAPRDIRRASAIAAAVRRRGLATELGVAANGAAVTVVDRIGVLAGLYEGAAVAFVGGTLSTAGGHNFLEAVAAGTPVVLGSNVAHIDTLVRPFAAAGCVAMVQDGRGLHAELRRLLGDEGERACRAAAASALLEKLACCATRYAEAIAGSGQDSVRASDSPLPAAAGRGSG